MGVYRVLEQALPYIVGVGIPILGGLFAIWLRVEARQDQALGNLARQNQAEHDEIIKQMTNQHGLLRDKIEKIWQHLSRTD